MDAGKSAIIGCIGAVMTSRADGVLEKLGIQGRIVGAVLLQDMRTRFGRSYLSYLIAIVWPLFHILFIMGAYMLVNSFAPVGDDPAVFLATGMLPYILCLYPARQLAFALAQNRQLLNIPILRPAHLIAARLVLELSTASLVCIIFYLTLFASGIDIWPSNLETAVEALSATLFLAIGLGTLNIVIVALLGPFAIVGFILVMVGLYVTSGVYMPIRMIPEPTRSIMLYNPLAHLVEWMRSAYFASYESSDIGKTYVIGIASVTLLLGLLGERFMRNKMLN